MPSTEKNIRTANSTMTRIRLSLLGLVLLLSACDAGSITDSGDLPPTTVSADSTIGDPWADGPG